jgi:cell division protein YceG involved in septum cleavage
MVAKKKKKKSNFFKYVLVIGLVLLALALYKLFALYQDIEEPNVKLDGKKSTYIYIPTGANYKQVTNI